MSVFGLGSRKAAKSGHDQPAADEDVKLPLEQVETKQKIAEDCCVFCS